MGCSQLSRTRTRRLLFVFALVVAQCLVASVTVSAAPRAENSSGRLEPGERAEVALEAVERLSDVHPGEGGVVLGSPAVLRREGGNFVPVLEHIELRLPSNSSSPMSMSVGEDEIRVSLDGVAVDAQLAASGDLVYPGVDQATSFVTRALETNGVQVMAVMESAEASREQRYNFELPRGASLRLNPDGSVGIVTRQGRNGESGLGGIEVPWAVDAAGRSLPSRSMIDGNTLIQITDVDASTAYPVVADPKMRLYFYDCGIVTCTRWVDVDITKYVYDRRGDETILYWGIIMGAACAVASIFGAATPAASLAPCWCMTCR